MIQFEQEKSTGTPHPKLEIYKNSPYYRELKIKNMIQTDIKNERNNNLFFKSLRKYLTNESYYVIED